MRAGRSVHPPIVQDQAGGASDPGANQKVSSGTNGDRGIGRAGNKATKWVQSPFRS